MKLTKGISDFLQNLDIAPEKTSMIVTNRLGFIKKSQLNAGNPFVIYPSPELSIDELFPGAINYIGEQRNIYIPNVQTLPNKYFDVHILSFKTQIWFLFIDISENTIQKQKSIEKYNTSRILKNETSSELLNIAINQFGVVILKHQKNNRFKIVSQFPDWLTQIIDRKNLAKAIELDEYFPYLENFFQQYLTNSDTENEKMNSGLWIQEINNSEIIYLQALGFKNNTFDYLLVYPSVSNQGKNQQALMQKARENVLAYEKLKKQDIQLKKLLKFKEQFAAVISHDFKTPLVGLSDGIEMLMEDSTFTENIKDEHLELLKIMKDELTLLNEYNDKIYNWSRLENENFKLNIELIDVADLFQEVIRKFKSKSKEKNISLVMEVEETPKFHGDFLLFHQALFNLVENSIKYSYPDSTIKLRATKNSICILDNGIGMDKALRNSLFGNLQNKSRVGTLGEIGTGLGLGIVKKIVASHGFNINIKSKENQGTEFTICF